jgi:hypothetical protein
VISVFWAGGKKVLPDGDGFSNHSDNAGFARMTNLLSTLPSKSM